ncbi:MULTISPECIES: LysR family transcriptional regulator [Paraburkholderia]|jgi:DNA-binding transcriptional LysR family regulator|uniref:LysR family transcriptional regulator n=1 Tax=Paraburkholderia TaxID=1822464 RepID=UPI001CC371E8|nr:LysR family transcriptional regulator [Paraburkholderia caribensis]GJH33317.1 LysR family transcriptional regulator [Paraburkholderia hospita]
MIENSELSELAAFAAVATHRSFRKAAIERGTSASAVSHAIRNLETRVGVRLLHRTTRNVSLTDAGQMLFAKLSPALSDIRVAVDDLNSWRDTPFGTVRLNVPNTIAPFVFGDAIEKLLKANPGLRVEIVATDRRVDIVEEGFDAGIRLGERLSQDMVAVRIRSNLRFAVVGSPAYFEKHGVPSTPHDLHDHACIRYAFPSGTILQWEFQANGEFIHVEVDGPLTVDSQELMVDAASREIGLAYVWERRAESCLRDGRLVRCLEDWCPLEESIFLYYPSRKHQPAGLRAVIDALKA